jgi:hypothetical protein
VDVIKALVAGGANKMAKAVDGCTPLHLAAGFGRVESVEALAELGVDLDAKDASGQTALDVTVLAGHPQVARLLRKLQSADSQAKACAACGSSSGSSGGALKQCSRCKEVKYCSALCQKTHWRQHKAYCKAAAAALAEEEEQERKLAERRREVEQAVAEAQRKMQLQLKDLPPNPTSGTPMEQQQQRKERQRARRVNDALLQMASE